MQKVHPQQMKKALQENEIERTVVVIGSGGCGKTCILHRLVTNNFSDKYVPTVFDDHRWKTGVKDKTVALLLKDTAGQEDYDRLIPLAVSGADVIIFCYSVDDRRSFEDIKNKYIHIVPQEDLKRAKLVLLGNKTDLRLVCNDFVTKEEGITLGSEIKAVWVFESSAKNNEGVHEIFNILATWAYNSSLDDKKRGVFDRFLDILKCGCFKDNVRVDPETMQ